MNGKANFRWALLLLAVFALALLVQGSWAQEGTSDDDDDDCVQSPDYWVINVQVWVVVSLELGDETYNQTELLTILSDDSESDASIELAQQLIAAKLSVASGAASDILDSLIVAGDALLAGFDGRLPYNVESTSSSGQSMTALSITIITIVEDDDDEECHVTPTPEVTDEGTPEATPESTAEATSEATPESTPEATPEATPDDDDDDLEITIIIEGPVEEININIIVIYGIEIEVDPSDPILTIIQIGDIIRIEGVLGDDDDDATPEATPDDDGGSVRIIIIAIVIIIVDIDVVVSDDGQVWRDPGNCSNPPPPWAPANGWRRRCESGGSGNGNGNGGGDDDDDDDDDD